MAKRGASQPERAIDDYVKDGGEELFTKIKIHLAKMHIEIRFKNTI